MQLIFVMYLAGDLHPHHITIWTY